MKLNIPRTSVAGVTHEGGTARVQSPMLELTRAVLACFLWEDGFYESGQSVADRIKDLVRQLANEDKLGEVYALAARARTEYKLRHVPLLLLREATRYKAPANFVPWQAISSCLRRPDDMTELLTLFAVERKGRKLLNKIPKQVLKGIASAFCRFDEYQLAKYNRKEAITLRDALFLSHADPRHGLDIGKPEDFAKAEVRRDLWKRLIDGKLVAPDTWEVALSGGADKKATFTRLIEEGKLGSLALLRNLRNMSEAGVDEELVSRAILADAPKTKALPFRYIAAAKVVPHYEPVLDIAMQLAVQASDIKLSGRTVLLVDVSGSMFGAKISAKSELDRFEAAAALAILFAGVCEKVTIATFSDGTVTVPPRKGMALRDALYNSQRHSSTNGGHAVALANQAGYDRIVVLTDEQWHDTCPAPKSSKAYMVNVGSTQPTITYGPWVSITGFSEVLVRYIYELEGAQEQKTRGVVMESQRVVE